MRQRKPALLLELTFFIFQGKAFSKIQGIQIFEVKQNKIVKMYGEISR